MKFILWVIVALGSVFFLFTRTTNLLWGSSLAFNFLSGLAVLILCIFSFFYFSLFENVTVEQLKCMREKSSVTWFGWFASNLTEWTAFLLVFIPYVLIALSISKVVAIWFPAVSVIQTITFIFAMIVCMFMVFLLITVIYYSFTSRKNNFIA